MINRWITPAGRSLNLEYSVMEDILENPKRFGITKTFINKTHKNYGETVGEYGDAMIEIIGHLVEEGWIYIVDYFLYIVVRVNTLDDISCDRIIKQFSQSLKDKTLDRMAEVRVMVHSTGEILYVNADEIISGHAFDEEYVPRSSDGSYIGENTIQEMFLRTTNSGVISPYKLGARKSTNVENMKNFIQELTDAGLEYYVVREHGLKPRTKKKTKYERPAFIVYTRDAENVGLFAFMQESATKYGQSSFVYNGEESGWKFSKFNSKGTCTQVYDGLDINAGGDHYLEVTSGLHSNTTIVYKGD